MPQSHAAVYVHVVFSTKNRQSLISPEVGPRLHAYFGGIARGAKHLLVTSGGMPDHVHLLVPMGREQSLADMVGGLKASSSRWVHDTLPELAGFAWQAGYGAFSVSTSNLASVREYIGRQAEHHATRSFPEEYREILRRRRVTFDERHVWD